MTTRNVSNVANWEWDRGYLRKSVDTEYPLRVADSGPDNGLTMTLIAHKQDQTSLCVANEEEFTVTLYTPGEFGEFSIVDFRATMPASLLLPIEPSLTITSEALRSYSPAKRECFYDSERRLAFFKIYTIRNCYIECISNYTAMLCGCVSFYMPSMYFFIIS